MPLVSSHTLLVHDHVTEPYCDIVLQAAPSPHLGIEATKASM